MSMPAIIERQGGGDSLFVSMLGSFAYSRADPRGYLAFMG